MNKSIKNQLVSKFIKPNGLSLIEVTFAIGLIITGVVSGLYLAKSNLNAVNSSENRLIAANLARESIEVIRNIRDTNWLENTSWNAGIIADDSDNYRIIVEFDETDGTWEVIEQNSDIDSCSQCQIYIDPETNLFTYSNDEGNVYTPYKRMLTIKEICWVEEITDEVVAPEGDECSDYIDASLIGWEIISEVKWQEPNRESDMTIIDRIYDWR